MFEASEQLIRSALRGIFETGQGSQGLTLHRLPEKYSMHHDVDSLTQKVADQASGVRLAFATTASHIEVKYRATLDRTLEGTFTSPPSTVTLTTSGFELSQSHSNGDYRVWNGDKIERLEVGENSIATFDLTETSAPRLLDIWLPHNCNIELVSVRANAELSPAPRDQKKWIHYGSSISHSVEANEPTGVWPVVASRALELDLYSLGLAGSANLEQFAARTIAEQPADFISLKLGINPVNGRNMTRRTFVPAVHAFLDTIRAAHSSVPILVISPIYCEGHETTPGPTSANPEGKAIGSTAVTHDWVQDLTLELIREDLVSIVARRKDSNLHYLNGLELFGVANAHLMPDGLHPNAEGYRIIGDRFAKIYSTLSIGL
jgi:lysophospholipase L1-like esterase